MATRCDGVETRRRIVAAACGVFAERGFHGTTNAEICRRSSVNGAAINYHFRNKEALYVEAFKGSLADSLKRHPLDGGIARNSTPELRLKAVIHAILSRICDPENRAFTILHKEMVEPTGLIDKVMCQFVGEEKALLKEIVGGILGAEASEKIKELCSTSVLAQCLHPALPKRHWLDRNAGKRDRKPEPILDIEETSSHVFEFSLAALKAFAKQGYSPEIPRRTP